MRSDVVKTKREVSRPGLFSIYKLFWRNSTWERFLMPNPSRGGLGKGKTGFAFSHLNPKTHEDIMSLNTRPGVYEFAISKGSRRRYKVYIGESGSMRKRHQTYAKTGDHLVLLFDAALKDGCTIWRRCRYVKTKQKAVAWEAYFLEKYDYAWNAQQNKRKRNVSIVTSYFCLCMSSMSIVEEPPALALRAACALFCSSPRTKRSSAERGARVKTSPAEGVQHAVQVVANSITR